MRGPVLAMVAFAVCIAVGGAIAGGVYLLSRDDPAEEAVVELPLATGVSGERESESATGSDAEETQEPPRSEFEGAPGTSDLAPGRYIQAGSFRSPENAQREVDRLLGEGIEVNAVPADWTSELLPGFQVLLVGPLTTSGEEQEVLRRLEDASVAGFGRDLTPSEAISGPEAAAGAWSGELELSYLRGEREPGSYSAAFEIGPDGVSGTVDHLDRGCTGRLSLVDETGYSLAYAETIESGTCPAGGIWHLRPEGEQVTAVWLHDDLQAMVDGAAPIAAD